MNHTKAHFIKEPRLAFNFPREFDTHFLRRTERNVVFYVKETINFIAEARSVQFKIIAIVYRFVQLQNLKFSKAARFCRILKANIYLLNNDLISDVHKFMKATVTTGLYAYKLI